MGHDDSASAMSARSSHYKSSKHAKSHRSRKEKSRSHSPRRNPPSHAAAVAGGLSGLAASIFGGGGDSDSDSDDDHHHRRSSRSKQHSSSRSLFGGDTYRKNNSSKGSFFGLGDGNASRSSFFGGGPGSHRSPSYYKRSPRPDFITRSVKRLKRLLRDLVYYAKRHPLKVFMLVIMPLITGGFLTALLAKLGLRLPASVERLLGLASRAAAGDSAGLVSEAMRMARAGLGPDMADGITKASATIERGRTGGTQWERRHIEKDAYANNAGGWGDSLRSLGKRFS